MAEKKTDMNIDDALIEKPYPFTVEGERMGKRYYLYPVTLGKLHVLKRHMENLQLDLGNLKLNPNLEVLRVVKAKKEEVCKVIAYHTLKRKRDIFDTALVQETADFIGKNSDEEELAALLLYLLTKENVEVYKEHLGIANENERLRKVIRAKKAAQKTKNDFEFGGKTVYGTLIDQVCERYGWEYDYVVWGISLVNLQLLLADKIQNVYLTDEEKKKIPASLLNDDKDVINADDKENAKKILAMDWR